MFIVNKDYQKVAIAVDSNLRPPDVALVVLGCHFEAHNVQRTNSTNLQPPQTHNAPTQRI